MGPSESAVAYDAGSVSGGGTPSFERQGPLSRCGRHAPHPYGRSCRFTYTYPRVAWARSEPQPGSLPGGGRATSRPADESPPVYLEVDSLISGGLNELWGEGGKRALASLSWAVEARSVQRGPVARTSSPVPARGPGRPHEPTSCSSRASGWIAPRVGRSRRGPNPPAPSVDRRDRLVDHRVCDGRWDRLLEPGGLRPPLTSALGDHPGV